MIQKDVTRYILLVEMYIQQRPKRILEPQNSFFQSNRDLGQSRAGGEVGLANKHLRAVATEPFGLFGDKSCHYQMTSCTS
jgi:hypothetical protein